MNSKLSIKIFSVFILLMVLLTACGGSSDLQEQIIGQWEIQNEDLGLSMVFDFHKDGTVSIALADMALDGTYTWLDGDVIKITMTLNGQSEEILGPVQIEGDQLMITNDRGETEILTRVK